MCPSTLSDNNVYHFHQRFIVLSVSALAEGTALLHSRVSSSTEKASLGLFWPAHPLQIVSCISLSLVFKHRQVVCPGGARPQVILFLRAQTQCFLCAQVCQIVLQRWDMENATLSLFALMRQVRSHPYERVFVWLCQYYCLTPLLQMSFRWHSLRAGIEDYILVKQRSLLRRVWPSNLTQGLGKYF